MNMKTFSAILLAVVMLISPAALSGCSSSAPEFDSTVSQDDQTQRASIAPLPALKLVSFTIPVGAYDLSFEPVDLGMLQGDSGYGDFSGDFYNGKYYLCDKKGMVVYVYAIDGASATLENTFRLDEGYEKVSVTHDGKVYLSQGALEAVQLFEDGSVTKLSYRHDVSCSPDEDFAVTTWENADPTVIRNGEESGWAFKNLSDPDTRVGELVAVSDCEIENGRVIIGGAYAEGKEENYRVGIFDYDGNRLALSAAEDPVGYSALSMTENGVISANADCLYLHDQSMKPLGEIENLRSLADFDADTVSSFVVKDFSAAKDGAVYMLVCAFKADDTSEALLYRVTGF